MHRGRYPRRALSRVKSGILSHSYPPNTVVCLHSRENYRGQALWEGHLEDGFPEVGAELPCPPEWRLAPAVFSADVLLQCTGELPKGLFDRRQLWWGRRPGTQPSAVNRQLKEPLVHKHPRGVAVRQQVARAVELEIRPRTLARILRSHRQGSEKLSQRLDEEGHRVYGGPAQRL
jgi:hypothetical protein